MTPRRDEKAKSDDPAPRAGPGPGPIPIPIPEDASSAEAPPRAPPPRRLFSSEDDAENVAPGGLASGSNSRAHSAGASGSRLGSGSDALAAAVRAKTTVIKATRRLKRAGELRVNVLDASFESTGREGRHSVRVEVDAAGGVAKGATPRRRRIVAARRRRSTLDSSLP